MQVDERLRRVGGLEGRVAARRDVAEPCPKREQDISVSQPRSERRIVADREDPGVARRGVVEVVLTAEGGRDREAGSLRPGLQTVGRLLAPAAAADDDERPL